MRWLLLLFHLILIVESAFRDYNRNVPKRRCHQCNMPQGCSTGSCVGDVCVKTVAAMATHNVYVSKGCENYTSYSVYPVRFEETCKQELVFGVESLICYCSDEDYCNSSPFPSFILPFLILPFLL